MKRLNRKDLTLLGLITILFLVLNIMVINQKVNLHVDEVYTYGLANHPYIDTFNMNPEQGRIYEPAEEAWDEYMQVPENHRFDYHNVWVNQQADVHPPLYYILVHTVCSFFPEEYSLWFAGSINIIFAILTMITVFFLALELFNSKKAAFLTASAFVISAGILSAIGFMRMYIVSMFWTTLISWLMVRWKNKNRSYTFYFLLYLISVLGTLTHYYFLIWLFFLCLVWGVFLLIEKKYKDVLIFIGTMILSGITVLIIFPSILNHILSGHRGVEAFSNLKNNSSTDYLERLNIFYNYLNDQIFGGIFPILVGLLILSLVLMALKKYIKIKKNRYPKNSIKNNVFLYKIILLIVPVLFYYTLVAKIAAYAYDRYIQLIYPVTLILACAMIFQISKGLFPKKAIFTGALVLISIMSLSGLHLCEWEYLYRDSANLLDKAKEHIGEKCIYIYDGLWKAQPSFYEIKNYQSVVFVAQNNLEFINSLSLNPEEEVVWCVMDTCEQEPIFTKIESIYGYDYTIEEIGHYFFSTSYAIHS